MSDRKKVLITGAAGQIGTAIRPFLRERYRLRLHDRRPVEQPVAGEETVQADITDLAAMEYVARGVDAVVHLAGDRRVHAPWEAVHDANIVGLYNVFEAARRVGARKVVYASTNHVMGMYDRDEAWPIHPDQPIRPDSLYGVSKAFGEALARFYADEYGMSMICLRIGWFLNQPNPANEMQLRMWISPRDMAQLVWRSIEVAVPFGIYYGVSNNDRVKWDYTNARRELGYAPQDNSENYIPL
jgi:NAD+ dependent glucose-6-phosphate dehydrogenase